MTTAMQRNIAIVLGVLTWWIASEYTVVARFANHTSVYDTETQATQKALKNLRTTTSRRKARSRTRGESGRLGGVRKGPAVFASLASVADNV
jgi:hypothetical protein